MSPSALPLYNTDKLIYKSGFFNKFKETLPIVSWFLRKGEKGDEHLPGSGKLDKHGRVQLHRAGHQGPRRAGSSPKEEEKTQLAAPGLAGCKPVQAKRLHSGDK